MAVQTWKNDNGVVMNIDMDKCAGHAECVAVCPVDVFEIEDGKATAPNISECIECCACVSACPVGAIKHSSCE